MKLDEIRRLNQLLKLLSEKIFPDCIHAMQTFIQACDTEQTQLLDSVHYLKNYQSEAQQAWYAVLQKINTVGSYDTVVFEDKLIHAVIMIMGNWVYFCSLTRKELTGLEYEFKNYYMRYKRNPPSDCPAELKGRLR